MSIQYSNCKNCESNFRSNFDFCPHCGQKDKDELTIGVLFYNTLNSYFLYDSKFFKSFIPLMIRPGYLAKKFIQGKRLLYLHPAQLYLFISVIFFFLFSFKISNQEKAIETALEVEKEVQKATENIVDSKKKDSIGAALVIEKFKENQMALGIQDEEIKTLDSIFKKEGYKSDMNNISISGFNSKTVDSLIKINASDKVIYKEIGLTEDSTYLERKSIEQSLKLYKNKGGFANILRSFYDSIPIALFILLPIFALIMKLLFYKRGRYAHHLVFSFYFFAYLFTTFSIIVVTSFIWTSIPGWLETLLVLSTFIYLLIAVKQFYKQSWFISFLKSTIGTFVFSIVVLISIVFIGMFAFMSY